MPRFRGQTACASSQAPIKEDREYVILGAGYGGLMQGARMVELGIPSSEIRMVDRAGDVGGTWYWNRYPGAMCDIEAYVYMPLCDELGFALRLLYYSA